MSMIELFSAWNAHEYATFFPDFTYTSVRTIESGRYEKKSCHWCECMYANSAAEIVATSQVGA